MLSRTPQRPAIAALGRHRLTAEQLTHQVGASRGHCLSDAARDDVAGVAALTCDAVQCIQVDAVVSDTNQAGEVSLSVVDYYWWLNRT